MKCEERIEYKQYLSVLQQCRTGLDWLKDVVVNEQIKRRGSARDKDVETAVMIRTALDDIAKACVMFPGDLHKEFTKDEKKKMRADTIYCISAISRHLDWIMSRMYNMDDLR